MTGLRVPVATYRIQFTSEFGFDEVTALIPYLDELGVTDLYASPLLQAREGSEHGYDVTDPRRIDPGVGGRGGFSELSAALGARGMGLLLDIVPNHMAASPENSWWRDVLRRGPYSAHAAKFDIDWEAGRKQGEPAGKLVLPILDEPLETVLAKGELKLSIGPDGFVIHYHDRDLPVCPDSYRFILAEYFLEETFGRTAWRELAEPEGGKRPVTSGMSAQAGKKLWELYQAEARVRECLERALEFWNGAAGRTRFAELVESQHYRPVYWRDAMGQINYRRFFDINDLVSLRIEDEAVFLAVHARVLELTRAGAVTGLRIDHVDGLRDPEGYLVRLQKYLEGSGWNSGPASQAAGPEWSCRYNAPGFYVLVEKILEAGEELPDTWPVAGTTGYDFMNVLNGLFIDAQGLDLLDGYYTRVTGTRVDFAGLVDAQKRLVMRELFPGEMAVLGEELLNLAVQDALAQEIAPDDLKAALVGVTAALPVYRTYTRGFTVTPRDREYIEAAMAAAERRGDGSRAARSFMRRLLLLEFDDGQPQETRNGWLGFVMRWQQFTGPIMAKGFEDTVLYLYNRLVSFNEVGGSPSNGSVSAAEFHRKMQVRQGCSPHTMNATSTHDTKRGEDVRARINVLSEMPELWVEKVEQWRGWNAPQKPLVAGRPAPDDNTEFLVYQTLAGAWPLLEQEEPEFKERLKDYLVKAAREAKKHTSWLDPDDEYEQALCTFAGRILKDCPDNRFLRDLRSLVVPVAYYGALNSLAQVVLKAVCPGVPDIYLGTEIWDLSLVDPDNRRPVEFERRTGLLAELRQREAGLELARELLANWDDGRIKLYVTWKALNLRRAQAGLFERGSYLPLDTAGPAGEHVCALARHAGENWAAAAVPRLPVRLAFAAGPVSIPETKPPVGEAFWSDTVLHLPATAPARWQNIFTGETLITDPGTGASGGPAGAQTLPLSRVLGSFPVALLKPCLH